MMDDPGNRDLRKLELARRLVGHDARTQHILSLTGYTTRQFDYLRQRWGVEGGKRPHGQTYLSFSRFFTSARLRSEAAVAGAMFRMFRSTVAKSTDHASNRFNLGEMLCEVYEWLHASFPDSIMKFDQLHLLASGILKGDAIGLGNCKCGATILVDLLLASRRRICWACQRKRQDGQIDESTPIAPQPGTINGNDGCGF